jgi:hypothetical protein
MADPAGDPPHENPTVSYEETLAIRDDEGAGSLVGWVRVLFVLLVVGSLAPVVLVALVATGEVTTPVGRLGSLLADQLVVVAGLVFLLLGVGFVWLFVENVGRALDKTVRVQVDDRGVSVERTGSQYWQSSGVDVPFDAITAVEYVDPEESSFRVELGDLRAPKFFAGRSRDWVRLERTRGPAVYIGSDRPNELAEAIARRVPGDVTARPF